MILKILRLLMLFAMRVASTVTGKQRFSHMFHYLKGSGTFKTLGEEHRGFFKLIATMGLCYGGSNYHYSSLPIIKKDGRKIKIGWHHSTLYSGAGFKNRPELFYMIGGFSFSICKRGNRLIVSGKDRYDWHPNGVDESGREIWFSSPLGGGKLGRFAIWLMSIVFGREYFTLGNNTVTGEAGISNKLWYDLQQVGAREFNTMWSFTYGVKEINKLAQKILESDDYKDPNHREYSDPMIMISSLKDEATKSPMEGIKEAQYRERSTLNWAWEKYGGLYD